MEGLPVGGIGFSLSSPRVHLQGFLDAPAASNPSPAARQGCPPRNGASPSTAWMVAGVGSLSPSVPPAEGYLDITSHPPVQRLRPRARSCPTLLSPAHPRPLSPRPRPLLPPVRPALTPPLSSLGHWPAPPPPQRSPPEVHCPLASPGCSKWSTRSSSSLAQNPPQRPGREVHAPKRVTGTGRPLRPLCSLRNPAVQTGGKTCMEWGPRGSAGHGGAA